jgi:hypothetical protein
MVMHRARVALNLEPRPLWEIAVDTFGLDSSEHLTRAQEESTRRALKRLADRGEAVLGKSVCPTVTADGVRGRLMLTARSSIKAFLGDSAFTKADIAAAEAICDFVDAGYGEVDMLLGQLLVGAWKPSPDVVGFDPDRVRSLLPLVAEEAVGDPFDRIKASRRGRGADGGLTPNEEGEPPATRRATRALQPQPNPEEQTKDEPAQG